MKILPRKKLYLPAFSILAVVVLLLLLISISTYRNLDREKKQALAFLHRQGVTLLRSLEAGARTGIMVHRWEEDTVDIMIREVAQTEDIAYIYVFEENGRIIHHSSPSDIGMMTTWNPLTFEQGWVHSRIISLQDGTNVYEMAKFFTPLPSTASAPPRNGAEPSHSHAGGIIVLGLKMTAFEAARQADIHHAVVMAAIVFMLGTGAIFFIFVIQNYYLVERTLQHTQDYAQQVVSSMASGLLSIDRSGKVVSYNRTAADLLGLDPAEMKGKSLSALLDFRETGIQEVLDDGSQRPEKEMRFSRKDGETIPISLSVSPLQKEKKGGAVLILKDLREIKQLEEKVKRTEKLAAVGQLAAGIAHEIRNPMSSIRGFAQFLRHALKDRPKEQEYAEIMVKEVDRINRVVTDLLSFASPKAAEPEPTDADELIQHVIRLVEADARTKNIQISRNIQADMGKLLLDAYQMTQAFLNLLLNAIRLVEPDGRIQIDASVDSQHRQFVFQIEDNGPGVSPEHRDKIFDPFFTTRESGTGLGLAIVHKIIENHRGEIDAESPPPGKSRGCRFTIRIPVVISTSGRTSD